MLEGAMYTVIVCSDGMLVEEIEKPFQNFASIFCIREIGRFEAL